MGNLNTHSQQISESLREEYEIQAHPYLLHKRTQQLCTLQKVTSNSHIEVQKISQIIEQYDKTKCQSISKLRAHYYINSAGYCSDEQNFYLIFQGKNDYTLRQEFVKRRLYQQSFSERQISQVIQTYLCGLRQYNQRFQRQYEGLSLDSIVINQQTTKIHLKDPMLNQPTSQQHSDNITKMMLTYPSPQKLSTVYSSKMQQYNEFLSNLFSVGVIALQMGRLQFADGIYSKKKEVNYQQVKNRISMFKDQRLRNGLQCLLQVNPLERKKIYQVWGIENRQQYFLKPYNSNEIGKLKQSNDQMNTIHKQQKFKFNSVINTEQPIRAVYPHSPSNLVQVPPLKIQTKYAGITTAPLPSTNRTNLSLINFNTKPISTDRPISTEKPIQSQPQPIKQNFMTFNPGTQKINSGSYRNPSDNRPNQSNGTILSFKDFLGKSENPTLPVSSYNSINIPSPSRPPQNNIKFNIPNQNVPINFPNSMYKQSFTYYNYPSNKVSNQIARQSSVQTYFDSPNKERQIKSIIMEEKKEASIVKIEPPKLQPSYPSSNNQDNAAQNLLNLIQQQQQPKILQYKDYDIKQMISKANEDNKQETPKRPTAKHKHNSTIVEVKDEDSPIDRTPKQQEVVDSQYVVEEYQTGSRYEGFKSNGMRNGKGKFYYQDGGYYEGQWKNNKMDGFGKLYYEGGKLAYEGNWSQDQFNGLGKVYNDNPLVFNQPFDYSDFDLLEDFWQYYEGMLMKDTKQGRGKIKISNGQLFQGDFYRDRIQGFGKFHTIQGKVIEGIWRDSKLIKIINNNGLN